MLRGVPSVVMNYITDSDEKINGIFYENCWVGMFSQQRCVIIGTSHKNDYYPHIYLTEIIYCDAFVQH